MGFLQFLTIFLLSLSLAKPHTISGNTELRALMLIRKALDPEGNLLLSWEGRHPCSSNFEGVACNKNRKVTNITLQGKGLSGKIPPAVAELKCLTGLFLHYNNLSGELPKEISNLSELADLYLDVNNLSGRIPKEIGNLRNLQVLQLSNNKLTGNIPEEIGSLKKLSVLALQHNNLIGKIHSSFGKLTMLKRMDLSFNRLSGRIPSKMADISSLEVLDLQSNTLSGIVPPALKRLGGGLKLEKNSGLCGAGFPSLSSCTASDGKEIGSPRSYELIPKYSSSEELPKAAKLERNRKHPDTNSSNSSKFLYIVIATGVMAMVVTLSGIGFLTFFRYKRLKRKSRTTPDCAESQVGTDLSKDFYSRSASPLVHIDYSSKWYPTTDGLIGDGSLELSHNFTFNLEEVETATHYFSEANLLRKSNFSSVYKGILRDGSLVAIRSINVTSCKSEEADFMKGLNLLTSLRHENLVRLRGFCCSKGRGECFLVYDFAPNGHLSRYLDLEDGSSRVFDWSKRVSIINGVAKGISYLHKSEANKPSIIHRNLSVEKILIDERFNPLIMNSGLNKLLADDVVFSALKVSAAMGYLAPEYITTGRFTEKSDVYAFGVILLQILSGKLLLTHSTRMAAEHCKIDELIDTNLEGKFGEDEAAKLARIAVACTNELPEERPIMEGVVEELSSSHESASG